MVTATGIFLSNGSFLSGGPCPSILRLTTVLTHQGHMFASPMMSAVASECCRLEDRTCCEKPGALNDGKAEWAGDTHLL